jgi:arginyl-tRNA synthetase
MTKPSTADPQDLARELLRAVREIGAPDGFEPELSRPRDATHGDWASNAALVLSKQLGEPPRALAERIEGAFDQTAARVAEVEVAGPGFLNFRLDDDLVWVQLAGILEQGGSFGRSESARSERVNVEFVSANPTGPLHVAHGRGAALGDAIASLLEWTGQDVTREFYVNDAGRQIRLLAESVEARFQDSAATPTSIPEGGYHGGYVRELAEEIADRLDRGTLLALSREERLKLFETEAVSRLRDEQARDLADFNVEMDVFFSEQSLYESGAIDALATRLEEAGLTYRKDDAVWLRTTEFGDEKDRVLVKGDGDFTYFAPDLSYHLNKAERGYDRTIDVWGADHQGHEKRMLAALSGLGYPNLLEVVILQLVTVLREGEEVRMSKRAGQFVTLRELFDETGVDVARYFFLMRRAEVHLNFDLDLALDTSEANPVFKVQYAHARMCSVFARGGIDPESLEASADGMGELRTEAERAVATALLRFPHVIRAAADARAPHMLCAYLDEVAGLVNAWYHQGNLDHALRLLADGPTREGRLKLARATQITLHNGLHVLGLSAPQQMLREEEDDGE